MKESLLQVIKENMLSQYYAVCRDLVMQELSDVLKKDAPINIRSGHGLCVRKG